MFKLFDELDVNELVKLLTVLVTAYTGAVIACPMNDDVNDELIERACSVVAGCAFASRLNSIICTLLDDGCMVTTSKQFNDGKTPIK